MKGFVLYHGPSMLDQKPIVGIVTISSRNSKTGNMAQLWILRADVEPHAAVKTGDDESICGSCPHRHHTGGACYVVPFQGPLSIYRAWKRGVYAESFTMDDIRPHLADKALRLGAYGDPAALPFDIVAPYVAMSAGHTGYTHQVAHPAFDDRWSDLVMISVDTTEEAALSLSRGYRYFRVTSTTEKLDREVLCLAESKGMSCADCLLCDGGKKGKSVFIPVHGQRSARFAEVIASTN